jgi:hypothetical protein
MDGTAGRRRERTIMSEQTTIPTLDTARIDEIVAMVPPEARAQARLYLAAVAEATSQEERDRIKGEVVTHTLSAAARGNWCTAAEAALTATFGQPEGGRWLRSDGFDRNGYDADGYDREGFHYQTGLNRDGFDRSGRDADGYDKDGYHHRTRLDRDGYNRDGFNADGANREGLDRFGLSPYRFGPSGYDADGFNRDGFNAEGWDREGFNAQGFNAEGFDRNGQDRFRYDTNGFDREGYQYNGTDRAGYTRLDNANLDRPPYVYDDHPLYQAHMDWYNTH